MRGRALSIERVAFDVRLRTKMQFTKVSLCPAILAVCLVPIWGAAQVGPVTGIWHVGDPATNRTVILLKNARIAMEETRSYSTKELASRCSTGMRISSKGAFGEPESFVILFDFKSGVDPDPAGKSAIGWHEYWFGDTSALTINRVTKVLELDNRKALVEAITMSPLWTLKGQREIEGFEFRFVDGYSVEVELFSGGRSKRLHYSNPDSYEQNENLQFRAALHKLLSDLGLSSAGFVFELDELADVVLPSYDEDQAEQGADDQLPARDEPKAK